MSSTLLTEYRCQCGKLLFKGLLCECIVEVKCRRCGQVTTWGLAETLPYALIETDADDCMTRVAGDAELVLGCERDYLLGRPLADVFPLIRDAVKEKEANFSSRQTYNLTDMVLMLHDGSERHIESCVIPRFEEGTFIGYRVLSVPKRAQSAG